MRNYTKINIDGRWVSPRGGTTANTINPATGKCGGRMSLSPPADADLASLRVEG